MSKEIELSLAGISKGFPGVQALSDVSLDFYKGGVHAIVGENGAGKSTLIKLITGAYAPDDGTITIRGAAHKKLTPASAIEAGIAAVYQEHNLFDRLSVAENIFINEKGKSKVMPDFAKMRKDTAELYKMFDIEVDPARLVKHLSVAQMQILEILKAVSKQASILILDEPTAPITVEEVRRLFQIICQLRERGVTILYISHRLEEIFEICDTVSVLRDGKHVATMPVADTNRGELIKLMVGRELTEVYPPKADAVGDPLLEVQGMCGNGLDNLSFTLNRGEILGFAGLVGSGRTELMRLVYGADKRKGGQVVLDSKALRVRSPADALQNGIGLIPEDRKRQGCFLRMTVQWNISIASLRSISRLSVVDRRQEARRAQDYVTRLNIKTPGLQQRVGNLSGGNQQKVVLAKVLAANSDIIIFDEPTRGIDVGAKSEIYNLMAELVAQGKAIIMVSSDMEELLGMADRIIVLHEGRITGELPRMDFSQEKVMALASGPAAAN